MPAIMSSVEAEPIFRTDISTPLRPSICTTLVCGGEPSWTKATSRMKTTAPLTTLTGRLLKSSKAFGQVVEVDGEFVGADLFRADRGDQVLPGERVAHVGRRKIVGVQRVLVEIDLHLPCGAAIRVWNLGACDRRERRPDEILGEIEELGLRQRVARQRQLDDRNARRIVDEDDRRRDARRKLLQNCLRYGGDLRLRGADVDARLEVDFDDAVAGQRLRFDMLDVIDRRRERPFVGRDDAARHVVRRQAGIAPNDRDDRDADIGKNVGRRSDRRKRAENHDQDRHDDEGVRTRQRQPNDSRH